MTSLTISPDGIKFIQSYESCALKLKNGTYAAYPDPISKGDPWTIGWGSTGPDIVKGLVWTQAQCDARLQKFLQQQTIQLNLALGGAKTGQGQFDALMSICYNVRGGVTRIKTSTLFKYHLAGDFTNASKHFVDWDMAGGVEVPGIKKRRLAEATIYLGLGYSFTH